MASRDRTRRNELHDEIAQCLQEELKNHPGLKELNSLRRKRELEKVLTSEEKAIDLFQDLIKTDPSLAGLFGAGEQLVTSTGPGDPISYRGKQFPTFFRLSKEPKGGLVKSCPLTD